MRDSVVQLSCRHVSGCSVEVLYTPHFGKCTQKTCRSVSLLPLGGGRQKTASSSTRLRSRSCMAAVKRKELKRLPYISGVQRSQRLHRRCSAEWLKKRHLVTSRQASSQSRTLVTQSVESGSSVPPWKFSSHADFFNDVIITSSTHSPDPLRRDPGSPVIYHHLPPLEVWTPHPQGVACSSLCSRPRSAP